jgi:hypothetical protein
MDARKRIVTCFNKTMGLFCHAATHISQKKLQVTEEKSRHFFEMMKEKFTEYNPCNIINMNQSLSPY